MVLILLILYKATGENDWLVSLNDDGLRELVHPLAMFLPWDLLICGTCYLVTVRTCNELSKKICSIMNLPNRLSLFLAVPGVGGGAISTGLPCLTTCP